MGKHISIYLDESGDLGFDYSKQATSEYFVVALLVCEDFQTTRDVKKAVLRTIKNKLNNRKNKKRIAQELKGTLTTLQVKKYFFKHCPTTRKKSIFICVIKLGNKSFIISLQEF